MKTQNWPRRKAQLSQDFGKCPFLWAWRVLYQRIWSDLKYNLYADNIQIYISNLDFSPKLRTYISYSVIDIFT